MTVELDQVPFGIEKVKHPTVQPTRSPGFHDLNAKLL
jgi:hypothetical protein